MCFLLHILFTVTFLVVQNGQPLGARTLGLQPHCRHGREGRNFLSSYSGEQCILQGRPGPENEQDARFFSKLLDRGAIQPGKDF
jgi:hypothetical protein